MYCPDSETSTDGRRDTAGRRANPDAEAEADGESMNSECGGDDESAANTDDVSADALPFAFAVPLACALGGCKGANEARLPCRLVRDAPISAELTDDDDDGDNGDDGDTALKCGDESSADRRACVLVSAPSTSLVIRMLTEPLFVLDAADTGCSRLEPF